MLAEFDRPIFIMAAPRSGSTLLFETLQQSTQLWTLNDEGHALIERHASLRPGPQGVESNRLNANDLTIALGAEIKSDLRKQIVDAAGRTFNHKQPVRLLEKTPKNILRIPFLNALFPDALFIYLVRDPLPNIASIIEGWKSSRFVTYSNIQTRYGPWSFLLPPGWQQAEIGNLAEAAAWQWSQSHDHAMQDLSQLERSRWTAVSYNELLARPADIVRKLCQFCDIPYDTKLQQRCADKLPLSRYTLEKPAQDKWQKHRNALAPVMQKLQTQLDAINDFIAQDTAPLDKTIPEISNDETADLQQATAIGRNADCPCGSNKKYKRCCGALN
jgi:hypothetical protein